MTAPEHVSDPLAAGEGEDTRKWRQQDASAVAGDTPVNAV